MPYTVTFDLPFLTKLKKSTVAVLLFFITNISVAQIGAVRDRVVPLFVHHPRLLSFITSIFGIAILLHRPQVQKYLEHVDGQGPVVPVEPGAQLGDVKVTQP